MLKFMKNKILIPLLVIGALAAFFSFKYTAAGTRSSEEKRKLVLETVMAAIKHDHFSPRPIDDTFSTRVYHKVMDIFDGGKIFFSKQDVAKLSAYEFKIDDEIRGSSLEFFDTFDAVYQRSIKRAEKFYPELLSKPFDFKEGGNDRLQLDSKKDTYADGEQGLTEKWRKVLKFRALEKFVDMKDIQDKKLAEKSTEKLADSKDAKDKVADTSFKVKTDVELEAKAREDVKKSYQRLFKSLHDLKDDERFTFFMNAIAEAQDPHTSYLPPVDKAKFETMMSGSFFGIGAQLKENFDDGKIIITAIVTGSPSWKQGDLKAEDEIMAVAQGEKTPVDVNGFAIDDVVKLIRGEKGTEVRLTVKKKDGTIKVVPIIRDVVKLEETFAKSAIINSSSTSKIGYIHLPEFYADFNHTSGRRCATDIMEEVLKLKKENVTGIILDLRGNGGGSLGDVVEMSGIFVGQGPVVQVKNSNASVNVLPSHVSDTPIYSGPFIIMVDEGSASASEILAAAMQDYKRALIVGAPTYGKGTVQKMVQLDDMLNPMTRIQLMNGVDSADPNIGALKLTMEKFYRVNGGSTQLKGVVPDIQLPDQYDYVDDDDLGERRNKSALPYDEIPAAKINASNKVANVPQLAQMSKSRVGVNPIFKLIEQNSEVRKKRMDNNTVALNEKQYRKEQEEMKALNKKMEEIQKTAVTLNMSNIAADNSRINVDSASITKNKDWLKNVSKDIYIAETVNIINDLAKSTMKVSVGTGMK